jgi:hypothetical protein
MRTIADFIKTTLIGGLLIGADHGCHPRFCEV